jgi:hypothetical protein
MLLLVQVVPLAHCEVPYLTKSSVVTEQADAVAPGTRGPVLIPQLIHLLSRVASPALKQRRLQFAQIF